MYPRSSACLAAALVLSAAILPLGWSQTSPAPQKRRVLTIEYQKTEKGKTADYIRMEREYWKPVHQDRVNNGKITSWKLYAVSFPNGDDQEYDFVTMTEFANFSDLESPYAGTDFKKVMGDAKFAEYPSLTSSTRKLKRGDTLLLLLSTSNWSKAANKVLSVHYLRSLPGKGGDLMKVQREYFGPSNEELVEGGFASSWATSFVRFPQQLDFPYNYVSFNGYESLSQMDKRPPQAWFDKWRPKSEELMPVLSASRNRIKGQLWQLVDQTTPK